MAKPDAESPATASCPRCAAAIPLNPGYTSWCDQCEWNLVPDSAVVFSSFRDKINARFGERYGEDIFQRVMAAASSLKPGFKPSRFVAYILAGFVHASTVVLLIGGVLLLVKGWPNLLALLAGGVCLALSWILRPRFSPVPEHVLPGEDYPQLYGLVQRIADELGFGPVAGIAVDHNFNASFRRAGIFGRPYITIGLPLFAILDRDEQLALLGHEVGHGVNGDVQRSVYVGSAINALAGWEYVLKPPDLFSAESGLPSLFMVPVNLAMIGLAAIPQLGQYLLGVLFYRDSQRAEYFADHLASKIAGKAGTLSMLEKLQLHDAYKLAVQRTALKKTPDLFEELRHQIAACPERELERLRRKARRANSGVDASHPATFHRMEFIRRHGSEPRRSILSEEEHTALMEELSPVLYAIQARAVDDYNDRLSC